jgi:hypothetical protein
MYDLTLGMSQAGATWQTPNGKFLFSYNVRFRDGVCIQTPGFDTGLFVAYGANWHPEALFLTAISETVARLVVAFDKGFGYLVATDIFPLTVPGAFTSNVDHNYKWQSVSTADGLYLTNFINPVLFLPTGSTILQELITVGELYRAVYIEEYYGHLVIANLRSTNEAHAFRVAYSDLDDFDDFVPVTTNEADFYDLKMNFNHTPSGYGITGLKKLGDLMVIYTQSSIWNMRYVGFDNGVMQFVEQINDIGNIFPYSVTGYESYHAFIGRDDFYVYDGSTVQSIGGDIRKFFFSDLTTSVAYRRFTWGYCNPSKRELRWYYVSSASTGTPYCDKCVVFNWGTRSWYTEAGQSVNSGLAGMFVTTWTIDLLTSFSSTIDGLDVGPPVHLTIDSLDNAVAVTDDIYTKRDGTTAYREDTTGTHGGQAQNVILETGDLFFDDVQTVKEIDTILIDAYSSAGSINVFVSARDYLSQAVTYVQAGVWAPTSDIQKRFTGMRKAGRVFRFKFTTTGTYALAWSGMTLNVKEANCER